MIIDTKHYSLAVLIAITQNVFFARPLLQSVV